MNDDDVEAAVKFIEEEDSGDWRLAPGDLGGDVISRRQFISVRALGFGEENR